MSHRSQPQRIAKLSCKLIGDIIYHRVNIYTFNTRNIIVDSLCDRISRNLFFSVHVSPKNSENLRTYQNDDFPGLMILPH